MATFTYCYSNQTMDEVVNAQLSSLAGCLVSVQPANPRADHAVASVLRCVVVVDDDGVSDYGGGARQWQVGVLAYETQVLLFHICI
jgi:hypothetical protein